MTNDPATAYPLTTQGMGFSRFAYRTMPPLQPPRVSLLTLIGIFSLVVAVVVMVGRVVISHRAPSNQSRSARSVSTSK